MISQADNDPVLSVIVATDTLQRVERLVMSVASQTIASRLELVFVMTTTPDESMLASLTKGIHSVQVNIVPTVVPLAKARAQGVRAARSPLVFIAETHAYLDPDLLE